MNLTETHTYRFLLQTTTLHPTEHCPGLEGDLYALGKAAVLSQDNPTPEDLKQHFITAYQQCHTEKHTQNLRALLQKELQNASFPLEDLIADLKNPQLLFPHHHALLFSLQALKETPDHLRQLNLHTASHNQHTCNLESWTTFLAQVLHELGVRVPGIPLSEEDGTGYLYAPPEALYLHLTHLPTIPETKQTLNESECTTGV